MTPPAPRDRLAAGDSPYRPEAAQKNARFFADEISARLDELWRLKGLPDRLAAACLPTQPPLQLRLPRQ